MRFFFPLVWFGFFWLLFVWVVFFSYIFVLKVLKKVGVFNCEILLTTNLSKLSCGQQGLIATGEFSTVFRIATSTDVLSSHFLSSAVQVSVKIEV